MYRSLIINSQKKCTLGFTLIELLLVLLIATALVLVGVDQYKKMIVKKDLKVVETNVALLMQALNEYYHIAVASKEDPTDADRDKLRAARLYPRLLRSDRVIRCDNTGGEWCYANYNVAILAIDKANGVYQLIVKATVNDTGDVSWYQSLLNATSVDDKTLLWKQMPTLSIPGMDTKLWIFKAQLQQFKKFIEKK